MLKQFLTLCALLLTAACPAFCQINADFGPHPGSDGDFAPTATTTVDLSAAPTAAWDRAGSGAGVYDPAKWAVVFKYSSVTIPGGVEVDFSNNSTTAPVVWLVSGDVTINGVVNVSGNLSYVQGSNAFPGPGGFRGGSGLLSDRLSGGGFGVGGGNNGDTNGFNGGGGSYATLAYISGNVMQSPTYGNLQILPLIGGSGGSGASDRNGDGGAGGGAILIVATGKITLNGEIAANGGNNSFSEGSSGSGGAIRLVASELAGGGQLLAEPGIANVVGGFGRVRLEAATNNSTINSVPDFSEAAPNSPVKIWPDSTVPTVRIVSIGAKAAPDDPHASLEGAADVQFNSSAAQTVTLETTNVPADSTVTVRIVPHYGESFTVNATHISDDGTKATWDASVTFPSNYCAVQAHAVLPGASPNMLAHPVGLKANTAKGTRKTQLAAPVVRSTMKPLTPVKPLGTPAK